MKSFLRVAFLLCVSTLGFSQGRNINKLTLETTYSYTEIHKSLRDLVDAVKKENYFNDDFFNDMLKKILVDKQFTSREKVQLFYLMQKKLGYAFVGINYLPPKQNYFIFHLSKVQVLQRTKADLKTLQMDPTIFIQIADSHKTNDPIISANALLLATLLGDAKPLQKLHQWSDAQTIRASKLPAIFNHYVCLSASLIQDSTVTAHLRKNLTTFKEQGMIEDALCATYSRPNQLGIVKDYILQEPNSSHELAIETAVCALYTKVSENIFSQTVKNLAAHVKEPWKADLLSKIADGKVPFNYSLTNADQLVSKMWDGVQISIYNDGTLISNKTLLEFDPN